MKRPIYGRFQRFEIIQALCRHLYLVVGLFRKAQYLVVIFHLFHHFYDYLREESGFLVALFFCSDSSISKVIIIIKRINRMYFPGINTKNDAFSPFSSFNLVK